MLFEIMSEKKWSAPYIGRSFVFSESLSGYSIYEMTTSATVYSEMTIKRCWYCKIYQYTKKTQKNKKSPTLIIFYIYFTPIVFYLY